MHHASGKTSWGALLQDGRRGRGFWIRIPMNKCNWVASQVEFRICNFEKLKTLLKNLWVQGDLLIQRTICTPKVTRFPPLKNDSNSYSKGCFLGG